MLLSTSNDGHLAVWDIRKKNLFAMSDNFEEDLHQVEVLKTGMKVCVATGEGTVYIFSWGNFGDCDDRLMGHPNSIDAMIKYDENTLITGAEDGLIRAVGIHPNEIQAILGDP
jgi:hypothetical protein